LDFGVWVRWPANAARGGVLGVEGVGLATQPAVGSVGPVDLDYFDAGLGEVASDPGTVAAGALDPDPTHVTVGAHPPQQRPVAGPGGGERAGVDQHTSGVNDRSYMEVLVGVDAADDDTAGWCDAAQAELLRFTRIRGRHALTEAGGQDSDGTPGGSGSP
jgi:hypothetical protein